jgi:eukaryotic-like serine/threonine-protein kinase
VEIQSSPMIADGVVYFGCRDAYVYAVDAQTGKQNWKFSTEGSWVNNSPVARDGKIHFGTSEPGNLDAVDTKTGSRIFQLPTGTPVFSSMAIAGDVLYFGNFGGKLTAVDLKTKQPAWVFETDGAKDNAGKYTNADGTFKFEVLFPSPNLFYDDMVIAVGRIVSMGSILSSPVVSRDVVYVGSTDGNLYALE